MSPVIHFVQYLVFAISVFCGPVGQYVDQHPPTVYLAGDSTMAVDESPIAVWGVFLPYSLSIPIVNRAVAGTSAQSYTSESHFMEMIDVIKVNDLVVIEFGHNDGGSLSDDNGRTDCPGAGNETCQSNYSGHKVTVYTFAWYLIEARREMISKGAKIIISSQTPDNPWETGSFVYGDGDRFVGYAKDVALALGSDAVYVDHGAYTANIWKLLGQKKTDECFPVGHTHTSPAGAAIVAQASVKGVHCGGGEFLKGYIRNNTASIPGACL